MIRKIGVQILHHDEFLTLKALLASDGIEVYSWTKHSYDVNELASCNLLILFARRHWRNSFQLCIHKTVTGGLKVMSDTVWIERLMTFKPVRKIVLFINKITPIVTPYRK